MDANPSSEWPPPGTQKKKNSTPTHCRNQVARCIVFRRIFTLFQKGGGLVYGFSVQT